MTTLPELARALIAETPRLGESQLDRDIRHEAQWYLDLLEDGQDEPDELLHLLAKANADDDFDSECYCKQDRTGRGVYDDFSDWYDGREGEYLAAVRSTFGMVSA
jgi:hypothetical protein